MRVPAAALLVLAFPASAQAAIPKPVVASGQRSVKLGPAESMCWTDDSGTECVDLVPDPPPDGTLRVRPGALVRIDTRAGASAVRLGTMHAWRIATSHRHWEVRVPQSWHGHTRVVDLVGVFPGEPESDYHFGPVRIAVH